MCGIVAYTGKRAALPVILEGLKKLEYRGYDSAGISCMHQGQARTVKALGKLRALEEALAETPLAGKRGIGHTRWATHGRPSVPNAHPHTSGDICLVHNGIIENHKELAQSLEQDGYAFASETDTEVLAHLIASQNQTDLLKATRQALTRVRGAYAIALGQAANIGELICARNQSPLVIGLGEEENFVASDIPALLAHTRRFIFLEDGDIARVTPESVQIYRDGQPVERPVKTVSWSASAAEKGGYKHFMLKEIHEQPEALRNTMRGRYTNGQIELSELSIDPDYFRQIDRIQLVACGTSWHAGLVGKYYIEKLARIPVEVDIASEYRYRDKILNDRSLVIPISQSGETADTLAALKDARALGARVLAICNVVDSSIAREADGVFYTNAGPEIGVASTKAFTTQLCALYLSALYLAQQRDTLDASARAARLQRLEQLPDTMEQMLENTSAYERLAHQFHTSSDFLFLGRSYNFPIALEGALKLKEISYIHAEGYASGEMKHGPIALIDENMPVVVIATASAVREKAISNVEEVMARDGRVIAIVNSPDEAWLQRATCTISVPQVDEELSPILNSIPMQLIAYQIADFKGCDVDQPRNLAKSVTVE